METLDRFLTYVQAGVFAALALIAWLQWRRRGGSSAGWLAATMSTLGVVVVVGLFVPEHSSSQLVELVRKAEIAVIVLFPYFLFRFAASFGAMPRWLDLIAATVTALLSVGAFLMPSFPESGETRSTPIQLYIIVLLLQWFLLSAIVSTRLWRAGKGQPNVARQRMRTLSLGAMGLAIVLIIAGAAPAGDEVTAFQIVTQLLALAIGPLLLFGFAPPALLRMAWRRPETAKFQQAEIGLMEAATPTDVATALLPHVSALSAGRGSVLLDQAGSVVGKHGLSDAEALEVAQELAHRRSTHERHNVHGQPVVVVPMRLGEIGVVASPYTPFFGQEETDLLHRLGSLADLAFDRSELYQQLVEAQQIAHVGSWEWDLRSEEPRWSDEMYRIYGLDRHSMQADFRAILDQVHPEDREPLQAEVDASLRGRRPFFYRYRVIRPDGRLVHVEGRGKPILDDQGEPIRMVGTVQDITELKRQEEFRDRFIANAAHELRTPMTSLVGFVELLERGRARMPEEQVEEIFDAMARAGERLATLVTNLLDLSKLQEGEMDIVVEPVALASVVQRVVTSTPHPEGVSVEISVDPEVTVAADPFRLDQVLTNLLTNAFRYGGSSVTVSSVHKNGRAGFSVTDDGSGVEQKVVPQLFEPFARGAAASKVGGSGLGLAIVKMIVDAMGGDITYETHDGGGARFTVLLTRV